MMICGVRSPLGLEDVALVPPPGLARFGPPPGLSLPKVAGKAYNDHEDDCRTAPIAANDAEVERTIPIGQRLVNCAKLRGCCVSKSASAASSESCGVMLQRAAYAYSRALEAKASPKFPPGVLVASNSSSCDKKNIASQHASCSEKVISRARRSLEGSSACTSEAAAVDTHLAGLLEQLGRGTPQLSLLDVLPCLIEVARDRRGCEFLQARLPHASKEMQALVFRASLPQLVSLSGHLYGHLFVMQLMDVASTEQMEVAADRLVPDVQRLALHPNGCHVIQKALRIMTLSSRKKLVEGLKDNVLECIESKHGNHVIQACIENMPPTSVSFIMHAIEGWGAGNASAHVFACRIVIRLLEHTPPGQMRDVLHQILQSASTLAQDRYGNYVLQSILTSGELSHKQQLFRQIVSCGLMSLSTHKYAHNVVVKCISILWSPAYAESFAVERTAFANELLWESDIPPIVFLVGNRFGATVIQCLVDNIDRASLEELSRRLPEPEQGLEEPALELPKLLLTLKKRCQAKEV